LIAFAVEICKKNLQTASVLLLRMMTIIPGIDNVNDCDVRTDFWTLYYVRLHRCRSWGLVSENM